MKAIGRRLPAALCCLVIAAGCASYSRPTPSTTTTTTSAPTATTAPANRSPAGGAVPSSETTVAPATAPATTASSSTSSTEPHTPEPFPVADATRIRFAAGTSGATVDGTANDLIPALYVLSAAAGQRIDLTLTVADGSPSASLSLYTPGNTLIAAGSTTLSALLPYAGSYGITVMADTAGMTTEVQAPFSLEVSVVGSHAPSACLADCLPPQWQVVHQHLVQGTYNVEGESLRFFDPTTGHPLTQLSVGADQAATVGPEPSELGQTFVSETAAVALATARIVSIEYDNFYGSPQRATVADEYSSFNWDIQQGRELTAADLLVDHDGDGGSAAWQALRAPILDALAVHFAGDYTRAELDAVEFYGPGSDMLALTPDGLDVGLSKCEIFDCATGGALVAIPYAQLGGILQPQWILGSTATWSASTLQLS